MPTQITGASAVTRDTFALLVNAVRDYAIFALDPSGFIQTWNEGARRLKGYEASEIIGQHFSKFYSDEDRARGHPAWELAQATEHGTYEEEGWRVRKDGSRFWVCVVITALRGEDGTLRGFGKVTRDLTARKQAEEALRQSEERYRLLVNGIQDYAIIMLDAEGRVTAWNDGAKRLNGYDAKEILGQHLSRFYEPADITAGKPELELEVAAGTGRFEDEGWRLRRDGSRFWANVVVTPIRDSSGKPIGFSKITRDITERRMTEEALRSSYANLERRVQERTAELVESKERAERAVQARDEFFSIASHELRTPLTSLKLRAQLAKRVLEKKNEPTVSREQFLAFITETDSQLDRLARLVEDMLDLVRVSQGQLSMDMVESDLSQIATAVVGRMAPLFRHKDTPLGVSATPGARVMADPLRIEQVLNNLLSNAIRYAPGTPVQVSVSQSEDRVELVVADQGPGISPESHEQVFNRYERLVPDHAAKGLGIGLYLARSLVKAHGGTLHVESQLGKGARFVVRLPSLAASTSKANPQQPHSFS